MSMPADLEDCTPVLVGVGVATQRVDEAAEALEPLDLMLEAVRRAGADAGGAHTLAAVQRIAVPKGRWRYRNPGRAIAQAIGAPGAATVLSTLGVLQQSLINDACAITVGNDQRTFHRIGAAHRAVAVCLTCR